MLGDYWLASEQETLLKELVNSRIFFLRKWSTECVTRKGASGGR
jgi:hypothetical protein